MSDEHTWGRGRVFAVPLLMGGYAFGYLTCANESEASVAVVFEGWSESPEPPDDLEHRPIAVRDLLLSSAHFRERPDQWGSRPWILTSRRVPRPMHPETRHWRTGDLQGGYRSIDIERPTDRGAIISSEAAIALPALEIQPVSLTVARIEVLAKRLTTQPIDHFDRWLRSKRGRDAV